MSDRIPLAVVDAANVVGSVPDGWWKDRLGAAGRLRDALARDAGGGLAAGGTVPEWASSGPVEFVLVVEGAARELPGVPGVEVVGARGSGDDEIVRTVARALEADPERRCVVVTADRELRARVTALGAVPVGPRSVRRS